MLAVQRREEIKQRVLEEKSVTVAALSRRFSVSAETIRRDLDHLEKEGFIDKSYGGATLRSRVASIVTQQVKSGIMLDSKRHMAKLAAKHIHPNDCIFMDDSTSVYEICHALPDIPLTVMTNSLYVLSHFAHSPSVRLVCPGGRLDIDSQSFYGVDTIEFIKRHYLDKVFLSCHSLDMLRGICTANENAAILRRTIIQQATSVYLLADHSKFDRPSFVRIADFDGIDYLLTDKPLREKWRSFLQEKNVKIGDRL